MMVSQPMAARDIPEWLQLIIRASRTIDVAQMFREVGRPTGSGTAVVDAIANQADAIDVNQVLATATRVRVGCPGGPRRRCIVASAS